MREVPAAAAGSTEVLAVGIPVVVEILGAVAIVAEEEETSAVAGISKPNH